jgi:tRNA(Ile2) C34 agmatinyltransferase TiaS
MQKDQLYLMVQLVMEKEIKTSKDPIYYDVPRQYGYARYQIIGGGHLWKEVPDARKLFVWLDGDGKWRHDYHHEYCLCFAVKRIGGFRGKHGKNLEKAILHRYRVTLEGKYLSCAFCNKSTPEPFSTISGYGELYTCPSCGAYYLAINIVEIEHKLVENFALKLGIAPENLETHVDRKFEVWNPITKNHDETEDCSEPLYNLWFFRRKQ